MALDKTEEVKNVISIQYPGVVNNVDNMIETFRGWQQLNDTLSTPNKRLRLWFRPTDQFSKPVLGTRKPVNAIVLKIRVKKMSRKVVSYHIEGHIQNEYNFSTFCDFQFIPMDKNGSVMTDQILPTTLDPGWLSADGPLFLLPGIFSRVETVKGFSFKREPKANEQKDVELLPSLIVSSRKKRYGTAIFVDFHDQTVPQEPSTMNQNNQGKVLLKPEDIEKIKQLFEERPVMSRSVMAGLSGISEVGLKLLAPCAAYHFSNGPWRAMWVRYGYDPRKDPSARKYQTLDFRRNRSEKGTSTAKLLAKKNAEFHDRYIFRPGHFSESSVCFYQICDIEVPEVQALLNTVESRPECHPTDGWLPEGTYFALRRILRQYAEGGKDYMPEEEFFEEAAENFYYPDDSEGESD